MLIFIMQLNYKKFKQMKQEVNISIKESQQSGKIPFLKSLIRKLCPCINKNSEASSLYQITNNEQTRVNLNSKYESKQKNSNQVTKKNTTQTFQTVNGDGQRQKHSRSSLNFNSFHQVPYPQKQEKYENLNQTQPSYPIGQYKDEQMLTLGKNNYKMLVKISSVHLKPSAVSQRLVDQSKKYQVNKNEISLNIDKYWSQRYYLFQKFDEGISINQNSWPHVNPQVISQYISDKIKCPTVVNMQCGIGGEAIKLSSSCGKVLIYDESIQNLKCLKINARVYNAQNIKLIQQLPKNTEQIQAESTLISLYDIGRVPSINKKNISIKDLKPDLGRFIQKSLLISTNLAIVLPPNIEIQQVISAVAQKLESQKIITQSCFIKVQKMYFMDRLRCIVIYYGNFQKIEVKINDELKWLYQNLKISQKNINTGKKIFKKLRQSFGMIKLLNLILDIELKNQNNTFQILFDHIKLKKLMPEQKLNKILKQIPKQTQQESFEQNQRTISLVSSSSLPMNRVSFQNKMIDSSSQAYKQGKACRLTHKTYIQIQGVKRANTIQQGKTDWQNRNNSNVAEYNFQK